ncbi:MAG: type I DNA topoisomerase [Acidimicrobiales bacterium]
MPSPLVIVESPAKARTIAGFLGGDYQVESSIGHIRDLPRNADEIPTAYKAEPWARLGVDVDNDFKPLYIVTPDKRDQVRKLKSCLKEASEVYLATDEDREGEAIAWHLLEVLNPRVPVKRMVFHEITPQAIRRAIDNPRDIDRRLVDAQEARRILDRLYGYEVSPVLWRKVLPKLSAGRVQSVAVRVVVEREWARMRFVAAGYWDLEGVFARAAGAASAPAPGEEFSARLVSLDARRVAVGRDFGADGRLDAKARGEAVVLDEAAARRLAADLAAAAFAVRSVESKPYRRRPAAPFMTSTLQQEAGRKLRLSSAQAMRAAQSLYEQGFITYMRTDSTTLSDTALAAARSEITARYGAEFLPDAARQYANKVRNAQEAHEAIRPAGETFQAPEAVARRVNATEASVYDLIWRRTIASQMTDAVGSTVTVRLGARSASGQDAEFSASGTVITHAGFQRAYVESTDEPDGEDAERRLPALSEGDPLAARSLDPQGHTTQPPARYTEASLVKRLEELGVGRPSTYASIMQTIQDRGYVWKKGSALVPSFTAFAVVNVLEGHFPDLVDYAFTARMEDDLDSIASGAGEAVPWLSRFYFGAGGPRSGDGAEAGGLKTMVASRLDEIDPREVNAIPLGLDAQGEPVVVRVGRYGPYLQRGEDRASVPEDLAPDELTIDKAIELLEAPSGDRSVGVDPATGQPVLVLNGRFGAYVQLGETPENPKADKPKRASLFRSMHPATVTLEEALALLSLPRVVGVDPSDGVEIVARNGRFGPYLDKGGDSRSLDTEDQLFTVELADALARFAEPKRRRGAAAPKPPLRDDLGEDPLSGKPIVMKEGRFGPYVTDGETNASLRKGDDVAELTHERAVELLADRRARGPAPKRTSRAGARSTTAKTGAAKAATTKTKAKAAATKTKTAKSSTAKAKSGPAKARPAKSGPAKPAEES